MKLRQRPPSTQSDPSIAERIRKRGLDLERPSVLERVQVSKGRETYGKRVVRKFGATP